MLGSGILSLFRFDLMDTKSRPMKADYIPPLDDDLEIVILMVWGTLAISIYSHHFSFFIKSLFKESTSHQNVCLCHHIFITISFTNPILVYFKSKYKNRDECKEFMYTFIIK